MLASLIASIASGQTAAAVIRARRAAVAYAMAGLAMLCGAGFLLFALYIWAAHRYGPLEAALGMGGSFIVLAGIILVVHRIASAARARREAERRKSDLTAVGVAAALAFLPGLLRSKAGLGALLAPAVALAAYAIYRENSLRDDPDE